ncbi:MAG: 1,4-dihydroxy-2-naphthoate octaprenyltransferase [Anaerolineae bacterium]|nr:1,4-dihydroxy-2-naphthoate octaprenyltransferase [Anaerolineae bacterium]
MNLVDLLPVGLRPWYQAARPRSLPATYAALFVGGAVTVAANRFEPIRFLLALIGALLLQIGSNFINEYVDFTRGTDTHKVDGMGMVLSKGHLTKQQVLLGAIVTVVGGALIGLLLVVLSGPVLLWIGMFGVLVVVLYTAGPLPLAYLGLGEIAVFIAMGPLMTFGTFYAVTGFINITALLSGLPIAFTVAAILHANNMRDIDADRAANKRTLAVRFGMEGARKEFKFLIYGAYISCAFLIALSQLPIHAALVLITLPEAQTLVKLATTTDDPKVLHRAQGMTAQLHWHFGLALAAGWLAFVLVRWLSNQAWII